MKQINSLLATLALTSCIIWTGCIAENTAESTIGLAITILVYASWINTRWGKKVLNKLNEIFYDDNF